MKDKYKIIQGRDVKKFDKERNELIADGWNIKGNVTITADSQNCGVWLHQDFFKQRDNPNQ